MSQILVVDAMNLFIRSFAAINVANENGQHVGGIFGIMQSMKTFTSTFHPSKIIFCWEGKNAGKKRREVFAEYKEGRKVRRSLNRQFQWETPEAEWISFKAQLYRIKQYLETMPIYQIEVENMEADDAIAYICNNKWMDDDKVIISSDKDYFQLITEKVSVFRPVKKELIDIGHMKDAYKLFPKNWIIVKTLAGDASDSIPGIRGLGLKTINKLFPFLIDERSIELSEIFDHCQKNVNSKSKFYKIILDEQDRLKKNWEIMQLLEHQFSTNGLEIVEQQLEVQPIFKPFQLRLLFMQDNAMRQIQNFDSWNRIFTPLNYKSN